MAFSISFNEEKNQLLKATRGVCFEDVVDAIENKNILADIVHPNKKYKHQRVYIVDIGGYAYVAPYVVDKQRQEIFLKT